MKAGLMDLSLYKQHLIEKKLIAESTVRVYTATISMFLRTNPDIDSLETYNNYIIKYAIKKRCYHFYYALKSFIEFKIEDKSVREKLLTELIKPQLKQDIVQERKYLTEEQIFDVINSLTTEKHKVIALIQTLTGVRAGDILRLKRDNIVPEVYKDNNVLRLNITGKGRKRNVVYIHDEVAQQVILDYITNNYNHEEFYFIGLGKMKRRSGNVNNEFSLISMNYLWYWNDLKEALQKNLIRREDFASHDFRRCFARRVWIKWKDLQVLQNMLNHAQPAVTMRYLISSGLRNIEYSRIIQLGDEEEEKNKKDE
jgi:integrase